MLKPILVACAFALAAPAIAQSSAAPPTDEAGTASAPNDDIGAVGGNTVNSQNPTLTPTQMPLRRDEPSTSVTSAQPGADPINAGVGGPDEARDYPLCTRTVRDSCLQTRNSPPPLD